ncbi:MAG TPA: PQQ-dependent sugar dehydrogenase, partial [Phycisphaerales bacterium]|nr:PQQ-dependent sugar dehydrogenase [Phycisphaerales bacterium]
MSRALRSIGRACLFVSACLFGAQAASAGAIALTTTRVASGLTQPLYCTHAPNDTARLYIVEKAGRIKVLNLATSTITSTFLDISSIVNSTTLEFGLLGLCFDPDFANNKYFYVHYSELSTGNDIIARYTATNSDSASSATAFRVLRLIQPNQNHRGGWLDFGP